MANDRRTRPTERTRSRLVEGKVFTAVTLAVSMASALYLVISFALDYWLINKVLAIVSVVVYGLFFYESRYRGLFHRMVVPFMAYTTLVVVSLWIGVGGFFSDVPLFLIGILLLFIMVAPTERHQKIAVTGMTLTYIGLVILQYAVPEIIFNTPSQPHLTEGNIITTAVIGLVVILVTTIFKRSYDNDRRRIQYMMTELNHRVKNNLTLVSSLVRLKDQEIGDRADLSDVQHQVNAITAMHRMLQDHETITEVKLGSYVSEVLRSVFAQSPERQISLQNDVPDIVLSSRRAVVIGLILNELATNSLKYGFGGQAVGEFRVGLTEKDASSYLLSVEENGDPFPADIDIGNAETLGLQLIQSLAEQLDGTIELEKKPHPKFRLTFPQREK